MAGSAKPTRDVGWAFLFAMRREAAPFKRRRRVLRTFHDAPCPAALYDVSGQVAAVLETGIGAQRAARAAKWLLDTVTPRIVVVAGFAGALSRTLKVGDVLVASEVVDPGGVRWSVAVPAELGDLPCGRLLTATQLVTTPADKRALFEASGALAVDMESAAVAEVCQARRVPCAAVRAISDAADTALSPQLAALLAGGRVAPGRVVGALVRSPRLAVELWRLARDTRVAARRLTWALTDRLLRK